jgi:hypothetical protein
MKRYYFDDTHVNTKYATLWNGFLTYAPDSKYIELSEGYYCNSNRELDDIVAEITDINFYTYLADDKIYFSLCQDSLYYVHDFEKHIKKLINKLEEHFSIKIASGEFNAVEVNHFSNQYKYTITKKDDNFSLKKKVLNWTKYEEKKKQKKNDDTQKIIETIKNLKIN